MKTAGSHARAAVAAIRRRPGRALAICVPLLAVSVFVGTTVASARPEPTLAVSSAELSAAPVPLVRTFAEVPATPAVRSHPKTPSPKAQVKTQVKTQVTARVKTYKHAQRIPEAWNVDGCDHDYGTPDQCVPWKIPASSGQAACAWLKANGFGPLKVAGTNRQHLPEDAQGYVCAGAS